MELPLGFIWHFFSTCLTCELCDKYEVWELPLGFIWQEPILTNTGNEATFTLFLYSHFPSTKVAGISTVFQLVVSGEHNISRRNILWG